MDISTQNDPLKEAVPAKMTLTPFIHWLWVFVLVIVTSGIYANFWMYGRIKDINALAGKKYNPILWFFVPGVPLFIPFAFARFFRSINALEGKTNSRLSIIDSMWIAAQFFGSLAIWAFTTVYWADYNTIDALLLGYALLVPLAALYAILHVRFEKVKQNNPSFVVTISRKKTMAIGGMLTVILVVGWFVYEGLKVNKIRDLNNNEVFLFGDGNIELTVQGDDWSQIEVGHFTDGTAEYEFSGPYFEMYMVMFDHGPGDSVNSQAYWRIQNIHSTAISDTQCQQNHTLNAISLELEAIIDCRSRFMLQKELVMSKIVSVNNHTYELFGYFSPSDNRIFRQHEDEFSTMISGFGAAQ